jgi:hypothetical protein
LQGLKGNFNGVVVAGASVALLPFLLMLPLLLLLLPFVFVEVVCYYQLSGAYRAADKTLLWRRQGDLFYRWKTDRFAPSSRLFERSICTAFSRRYSLTFLEIYSLQR